MRRTSGKTFPALHLRWAEFHGIRYNEIDMVWSLERECKGGQNHISNIIWRYFAVKIAVFENFRHCII
jgi:hypothetical protein